MRIYAVERDSSDLNNMRIHRMVWELHTVFIARFKSSSYIVDFMAQQKIPRLTPKC